MINGETHLFIITTGNHLAQVGDVVVGLAGLYLLAQGVEVKAGQPIGAIGDTALIEVAEEPHVHFEMTEGGVAVNPLDHVAITGSTSYEG